MPSFHISSSGKLVQCKNDPCKLHAGTDFQAKDLKEAQKLAENTMSNNNPESLNKVENSNIQDYNNAIKNMDYEEFDEKHFTADFFKISETRFFFLLRALIDDGYITGVKCEEIAGGKMVALISPRLTLAGMEYLVNNTMMKKAYRLAKGIKDIMPCV